MGCGISSLGVEINFHNYIQLITMHSRMNVRKVGVQESQNGFGEKILSKKTLFSKEINKTLQIYKRCCLRPKKLSPILLFFTQKWARCVPARVREEEYGRILLLRWIWLYVKIILKSKIMGLLMFSIKSHNFVNTDWT